MATPFSPFTTKIRKAPIKKRQSQIPSDLIDWDAPEIPELEKQKIIYEDHIKELNEDHDIETFLKDQIYQIVHETFVEQYQAKLKNMEDALKEEKDKTKANEQAIAKEKSTVNLLLSQIKMFEENAKENLERIDQLDKQIQTLNSTISALNQEKENWSKESEDWSKEKEEWSTEKENWSNEREDLMSKNEDLNFQNEETLIQLTQALEKSKEKSKEIDDINKKYNLLKTQVAHFKRLAKNKVIDQD